ncbi:hexosyltransferase [Moorena producens PAL-8-15-08-1]|uniref:Hexosyltransferase n=1 Tax=Moorena producens PAL-8-15-08-1 TaxID=1458985 RepID=A0A1D8U0S7_9CYAN|nr:glycosyltransferase [Moorena producens]AOX03492.1 hexosyltransferase [Moorena producens PAL-8-15-08-1]
MVSIVVLFTNYGPYHLARLEAFHKVCQKEAWSLNCIELARVEALYPWRASLKELPLKFTTLVHDRPLESVNTISLISCLIKALYQINPDVIAIAGYAQPPMFAALAWSILNNKKAILLSASKEDDFQRNLIVEKIKSQIVKCYNSALVGGKPQKRYLAKLGMLSESIKLGYNVVGNDSLNPLIIKKLPSPLKRHYFLAVNRFVPKKNLFTLLEAYVNYRQASPEPFYDLVLCGDGELRPQIEQQIAELNLQDSVHLPGFLQQDQLLPYFAHANYFIHASIQEQWGLVVNEAMAAGLPVLVSNRCGCFEDLVIEGVNGFEFDPENPQQITELMLKMSSGEINLEKMGKASLEHIHKFSPDYFAEGLMQAVQYALEH